MKNQEIRVLRKRLHLTQQQFADKLNWSKSYLSMIETGKRTVTKECITRIRKNIPFGRWRFTNGSQN